jgi:hypothetical protein
MKKCILTLLGVFALTFTTKAQSGFENLLLANDSDRKQLFNAYMNPAMKGLIYGMNSGWYHTAKVHKPFGFDITVGLNASIVPDSDEMFKFADLNLTSISPTNPLIDNFATVMGSKDLQNSATVNTTVKVNGVDTPVTRTFNMPGGVKEKLPLNATPTPAIQLNVGLPWKLEANVRLVPKVGDDSVKGNLLGLGLKKEITDWFGPIDKTPLHISLLANFTSMKVDYNIDEDKGHTAEFDLNSYSLQAVASLNFPIINIYGGFGYSSGTSTLKVLGDYELEYDGSIKADTITDPINGDFDASGFTTTVGARLSLGFFKIFGSYSLQEYNTASLGVAFSIR